jgi:hypothetical protein
MNDVTKNYEFNLLQNTDETPRPNAVTVASGWAKDISKHTLLVREYAAVAKVRAKLEAKLQMAKSVQISTDAPGNDNIRADKPNSLDAPETAALSASKMRLALRGALESFRNGKGLSPIQNLESEVAFLDMRQANRRKTIQDLECRVLTKDPEDATEASALLRFIASMLAFGDDIEKGYLSDILDVCANAVSRTSKAPLEIVK